MVETQGIYIYIYLNPTATNWQPHCRPRISHHQLLLRPGFVSQAFRVPYKSSKDKGSMSEFKEVSGALRKKNILKQQLQFSSWNQICGICYGPLGFYMSSIAFRWRVHIPIQHVPHCNFQRIPQGHWAMLLRKSAASILKAWKSPPKICRNLASHPLVN